MQNQSTPLVSVITCFYNEERFLQETVASVLAQQYPHWELLLIDDGSSDASTQMAKDFAARHPHKIFYHEHEQHANRGLSASRNWGIQKSRGELLAFLDADDVWLPEKLAQQVALMAKHPGVGMICEASEYWYSWSTESPKQNVVKEIGSSLKAPNRQQHAQKEIEVLRGMEEGVYEPPQLMLQLYPLGLTAAPCPSGLMCRSQAVAQVGGFESHFTGAYQMYEDQGFLSKMYLNHPVYISRACNNRYRQRIGSLVQSVTEGGKYHAVRQYYLEWVEKYLKTENLRFEEVNAGVEKALLPYRQPLLHYLTDTLPKKGRNFISKTLKPNRGA